MGNWVNKHFRKSKTVCVYLFKEGQKVSIHYVIPKGDTVKIENKVFTLDRTTWQLNSKGFITYVFNHTNVEPINPYDVKNRAEFDPDGLHTAIESKVAQEILMYSKGKFDMGTAVILLGVVMLVGFGLLWYTLTSEIKDLEQIINPPIVEVVDE